MAWAPDYITATELAAFVRISSDVDDVTLAQAVTAASRSVDYTCHRQFGLIDAPAPRYYTAQYDRTTWSWYVAIDDLMTSVGLAVGYDQYEDETYGSAITAYRPRPLNAAADGMPWTELGVNRGSSIIPTACEGSVRVTAQWGWTTVPGPVKTATLLQASRLISRRDSPYGVAGSASQGSELRLLSKVDPDVEVTLQKYIRRWSVA